MSRLVTVAHFWDGPELFVAIGALRSAGLNPFAAEFFHSSVYPPLMLGLGGIRLMVPDPELEPARELVDQCRAGKGAGPREELIREANRVDGLICPQCGADNYFRLKSWPNSLAFSLLFGIPLAFTTGRILCRSCGHKWRNERAAD